MNTSALKVGDGDLIQVDTTDNLSDGLWHANHTHYDHDNGTSLSSYDILIPTLNCLLCLVGLVSNSLVIFTIVQQAKMRRVASNIYIFNLAMADGLFMLGLPFLALQIALHRWPFGGFMCKLVMILDSINQFTSVFCITMLSVDRYLAVVHPIRSYKWHNPSLAKKISLMLWLISFILVIPLAIYSDVDHTFGICTFIWPEPVFMWNTAFIVYTFVLGFVLPFIIITLCYIMLLVRIRTKAVTPCIQHSDSSEKKITCMVVAIVLGFAICWLPFYLINVCFLFLPLTVSFPIKRLFEFMVTLSYSNSCLNPILYICLSESFWRSFQMMLCPQSVRRKKVTVWEDQRMCDLKDCQLTLSSGEMESILTC
ncbi:somatostatin receptor type 5-like [Callorhinchus milii]|uniref:somatostatin receptor type 5-like n=1 Tax=Callorhinchus milii TaxID=7868 RepID=UPI001C3F7CF8|nr:somatostatin receptor type 5-like [Callorhinchus milii]